MKSKDSYKKDKMKIIISKKQKLINAKARVVNRNRSLVILAINRAIKQLKEIAKLTRDCHLISNIAR